MGEFHRSPSKVWWQYEHENWPRNSSASPGSQDSGFSDTENSQPTSLRTNDQRTETSKRVSKDILKDISEENSTKSHNLWSNFKQKTSPNKSIALELSDTKSVSNRFLTGSVSEFISRTPISRYEDGISKSEPIKRHRFHRNGSLRVSRNLFKNLSKEAFDRSLPSSPPYQYATEINDVVESQYSNSNYKVRQDCSQLWKLDDGGSEIVERAKTFSLLNGDLSALQRHLLAPAVSPNNRDNSKITSYTKDHSAQSSDCESEFEYNFHGPANCPIHTSTPKGLSSSYRIMKQRNKRTPRLLSQFNTKSQKIDFKNDQCLSVQKWLQDVRNLYEPECTTTLQCKSIAMELAQKVAFLASRLTATLRKILADADTIEAEFANTKSQKHHIGPLTQSLTRLVEEFIQNFNKSVDTNDMLKISEDIKHAKSEDISKLILKLHDDWIEVRKNILQMEIQNVLTELEDPRSEMHVRATVTGITSIALRNQEIINVLISCNVIQNLCTLCEKCESSTVRSLILRGLSTVCINNSAISKFVNAGGLQLLNEIISEETRPEPERSEAVALLAQITAPWIENNHIQGLEEYVKILVKSLTNFIASTKCCQNLLLCTAALANLTEIEPKSIKYTLHQNSVGTVLQSIKLKGTLISVYVLEQVATLIANLSIRPNARKQLVKEDVAAVLLHFIQYNHVDTDVIIRLQQKSIIALSRISSDYEAAQQIVQLDGVNKLVKLCRERKERHDSDAVLIAALATLRKIAEACGNAVIDIIDVQELIEPRLLDSFLTYSTQNESYV